MTPFHHPYTFDSRETYLAAKKQWAEDYKKISADRRQMKRDISRLQKEGSEFKASLLQYDLSKKPNEATVMLQKRSAMKEEAHNQVLLAKTSAAA